MKKVTLALTVLFSLGLSACSSSDEDPNAYKAQILATEELGNEMQLTIRKNNCSGKSEGKVEVITHKYDSTLVSGACINVSEINGIKNISAHSSRNPF